MYKSTEKCFSTTTTEANNTVIPTTDNHRHVFRIVTEIIPCAVTHPSITRCSSGHHTRSHSHLSSSFTHPDSDSTRKSFSRIGKSAGDTVSVSCVVSSFFTGSPTKWKWYNNDLLQGMKAKPRRHSIMHLNWYQTSVLIEEWNIYSYVNNVNCTISNDK